MTKSLSRLPLFFAFVLCVVVLVLHGYWAQRELYPVHDGSNCVARVANAALFLRAQGFGAWFANLLQDPNNFLSLAYFSALNFGLGLGRASWGWGWALAFFVFAYSRIKRRSYLPLLLLAGAAPLFWRDGGMLDQRFDSFSVLLLCAAVSALLSERLLIALVFSFLAVLAKGPALPVAATLWLAAWLAGLWTLRNLIDALRTHLWFLLAAATSLFFYVKIFLLPVITYNMMALRTASVVVTESTTEKFNRVARQIVSALLREPFYYVRSLWHAQPMLFALLFAAIIFCFLIKEKRHKRVIFAGLLAFLGTYLLFTLHPVHAPVLVLWFVPALWFLCVVLGDWLELRGRVSIQWSLAGVLLVSMFARNYSRALAPTPQQRAELRQLQQFARVIARDLQRSPQPIGGWTLVPNFLNMVNYDTFRVLLHEKLGRASVPLYGWEMETYGDQPWEQELKDRVAADSGVLLLLAINGEDAAHHRKHARSLAAAALRRVPPLCRIGADVQPHLSLLGELRAYAVKDATLSACAATL